LYFPSRKFPFLRFSIVFYLLLVICLVLLQIVDPLFCFLQVGYILFVFFLFMYVPSVGILLNCSPPRGYGEHSSGLRRTSFFASLFASSFGPHVWWIFDALGSLFVFILGIFVMFLASLFRVCFLICLTGFLRKFGSPQPSKSLFFLKKNKVFQKITLSEYAPNIPHFGPHFGRLLA
jgi:hypothetical protein